MEFIPIFAGSNPILFAVQYDGQKKDAFQQLFEDWQDPEYLFNFFTAHERDLQGGFYDTSVTEAIRITKNEAIHFRDLIMHTLSNGQTQTIEKILDLFVYLSESEFQLCSFAKHKAYGPNHASWLRIYAIKVQNCFLITGGAIKLTKRMDEREHTRKELLNLEKVKNKLISLGIYDSDGLTQ
jgi:hypothetical protein